MVKQIIFKDIKGKDNLSIPIFKLYIYDVGDFFSFIPYLIIKKKIKISEEERTNRDSINYVYIYNDTTKNEFKKNRMIIMIYMFLITTLVNFL